MRRVLLLDYDDDLFEIKPNVFKAITDYLLEANATLDVGQYREEDEIIEKVALVDILMIQSMRPLLTKTVIESMSLCRGIIRVGIGYDNIDITAASAEAIPVSNVIGWCEHEVAEHALALLLACGRKLLEGNSYIKKGEWNRRAVDSVTRIHGKTIGIIGLGSIGCAFAKKAAGIGMNIIAFDPYLNSAEIQQRGAKACTLAQLLEVSDFVSIHVPLNSSTKNMISFDEVNMMKHGSVIINTSRGGILNETALCRALAEGHLSGAGLDVFEYEPLQKNSPLLEFPNVIMTPHVGSYSTNSVEDLYKSSAEIAVNLLNFKWVKTIVNQEIRPKAEKRWQALANRN